MKKKSSVKTAKPEVAAVLIKVIPHSEQRYDTVGDWFYQGDLLQIRVSQLPNDPHNEKALAVAFHELCEVLICRANGITQKQVDKFDAKYNEEEGLARGDRKNAPYHNEHCFATAVERMLIAAMEIDWQSYEESINSVEA